MKITMPVCAVLVLGAAHVAVAKDAGAPPSKVSGATALAVNDGATAFTD